MKQVPGDQNRVRSQWVSRDLSTNPRARELPLEAFYDDRFVRELDQSGFVQGLQPR